MSFSKFVEQEMRQIVKDRMSDYQADFYNHDLPQLWRRAEDVISYGALWVVTHTSAHLLFPYVPGESPPFVGVEQDVERDLERAYIGVVEYYRDNAVYYWVTVGGVDEVSYDDARYNHLLRLAVSHRRVQVVDGRGRCVRVSVGGRRHPVYLHHRISGRGYRKYYQVLGCVGVTIDAAVRAARTMAKRRRVAVA